MVFKNDDERKLCRKEYNKQYYQEHRGDLIARHTLYNKEHPVEHRARVSAWQKENKDKVNKHHADYHARNRAAAIAHYGGKCACCGEARDEFLSIDHIGGGGTTHRKSIKTSIYSWLKAQNYPSGYRVLCMNCNWSLGMWGYCPHESGLSTIDKVM